MTRLARVALLVVKGVLRDVRIIVLPLLALSVVAALSPSRVTGLAHRVVDILVYTLELVVVLSLLGELGFEAKRVGLERALRAAAWRVATQEDVHVLYPWLGFRSLLFVALLEKLTGSLIVAASFSIASFAFEGLSLGLATVASLFSCLAFLQGFYALVGLVSERSVVLGALVYTMLGIAACISTIAYTLGMSAYALVPPGCFHAVRSGLYTPALLYPTLVYTSVYLLSSREPSLAPLDPVRIETVSRSSKYFTLEALASRLVSRRLAVGYALSLAVPAVAYTLIHSMLAGLEPRQVNSLLVYLVPILTLVASTLSLSSIESAARMLGFTGWMFESSIGLRRAVYTLAEHAERICVVEGVVAAGLYAALAPLDNVFILYSLVALSTVLIARLGLGGYARITAEVSLTAVLRARRTPSTVPSDAVVERSLWMETLEKKTALLLTAYLGVWGFAMPLFAAATLASLYELVVGVRVSGLEPLQGVAYGAATLAMLYATLRVLGGVLLRVASRR